MFGEIKKIVILFGLILSIGISFYWVGIGSPKKEMIFEKQLVRDIANNKIVPLYYVYYEWDGIRQDEPWWMIFKKHGEWLVVEYKDMNSTTNDKDILRCSTKFGHNWIWDYGFSAQPTRYQTILLALGFQPTFSDEKDIFLHILSDINQGGKIFEPTVDQAEAE